MTALEPCGEEIWLAAGPGVSVFGFDYPTRMAVIRLADGKLFIWSPVKLTDALRAEVDALGQVQFIVAPNSLHHLFLDQWRRAYDAVTCAPPGFRNRLPHLVIHGELEDAAPAGWSADIDQVLVRGNRITTEVVFFHVISGTVLFCDLLQHYPPGWFTGWRGLAARLDRMTGPEPQVPQKFRIAFADRAAARASLKRILAWPAKRVVMAHGEPVDAEGGAYLRRAFGWLLR